MFKEEKIKETLDKAKVIASDFSITDERHEIIWNLIDIIEQLLERI